jgi:hypothetical protein
MVFILFPFFILFFNGFLKVKKEKVLQMAKLIILIVILLDFLECKKEVGMNGEEINP